MMIDHHTPDHSEQAWLLKNSMPVARQVLGQERFESMIKMWRIEGQHLPPPEFFRHHLKNNDQWDNGILSSLVGLEGHLAQSARLSPNHVPLDVDALLWALWDHPQDIFFTIGPAVQLMQANFDVHFLWQQLIQGEKELKVNKALPHYYLINTMGGNTEVHELDPFLFQCAQFLKDDSTSLHALVFEFFGQDEEDHLRLEKCLKALIKIGFFHSFFRGGEN